jgi:hypothetical protein
VTLSTPVAFLIFNRPDLTEIVFEAIAQAKPKKLFVIADGPRFPEEAEKCDKAKAVINRVDWDCEVLTDFSEENLGCGRREASGFDWVFSQVEEAIFLEDDTLPTPSFFSFCQVLLERYRDDERIMHISGNNLQLGQSRTEYSYYFSKYPFAWGWASWRRAWKNYDYYMKSWPEFKEAKMMEWIFEDPYEKRYWTNIFEQMYEDPQVIDTWDYQWYYTLYSQHGLVIVPDSNLVSNLGFDRPDATHPLPNSPLAELPTSDICKVIHPPFIVENREADAYIFDCLIGGKIMREGDTILAKMRQRLSLLKKKIIGLKKD